MGSKSPRQSKLTNKEEKSSFRKSPKTDKKLGHAKISIVENHTGHTTRTGFGDGTSRNLPHMKAKQETSNDSDETFGESREQLH